MLQGIADRQLSLQRTVENVASEQHTHRADIRELRREVGLSMPPATQQGEQQAKRAALFHMRASFRYALVAAAGGGATVLFDWLAKSIGGHGP